MHADTAARAPEKVLESPNAMSTHGQQGAPQGDRVPQSWTARAVTASGRPGAAQRPPTLLWAVAVKACWQEWEPVWGEDCGIS